MRVLITGIKGTLGRPLKDELKSRGHDVYGCDLMHSDDPQEMRADVGEMRQLERVFDAYKPDTVYHLAAEFGRNNGRDFYEQMWKSNCIGTQNVIELCIKHDAPMIFASSSEAYGDSSTCTHPQGDTFMESWLDHYSPYFHNQYALSKWTNEKQIHMAAVNRGLQSVILRFFNAYGPGEYYTPYRSVVCLFCYRLMRGYPITVYKNYTRAFMYIDDWARTAALVTDRVYDGSFGDRNGWSGSRPEAVPVFNIGGAEYATTEALKDKIVRLLGGTDSQISYLDAEQANVISKRPDNAISMRFLGHKPNVPLDVGLPKTIAWMREAYGDRI